MASRKGRGEACCGKNGPKLHSINLMRNAPPANSPGNRNVSAGTEIDPADPPDRPERGARAADGKIGDSIAVVITGDNVRPEDTLSPRHPPEGWTFL
ncbi:MAG: hypothetical protein V1789_09725 [PVC group bacterium]